MNELSKEFDGVPFNSLQQAVMAIATQCNVIAITDETTLAIANQQLSLVKEKWNQIEAIRNKLKAPSLEEGRAVDALAKPLLTPLAEALANGKAKILAWDRLQQAKAVVANVAPPVAPKGIRKTMKFEVVDLEKVPMSWLQLNEEAVNAFKEQYKDKIKDGDTINGVHFYLEKSLTIR